MFRLPFVSRERYDDTVKRLESQLAAEKAERHQILDFLTKMSLGHPIFAAEAPRKPDPDTRAATATSEVPSEQDEFSAALKRARQAGCRTANQVAQFISRENVARSNEKNRSSAVEAHQAKASPTAVASDFDAAIAEGQSAAGATE